jgi:TfoX/Sxy family transcriptional regulator of competence genes
MAYDPGLAQRIREMLEGRDGIAERQMFGGIAFMSHGHMFVGVAGHALMARIGSDRYDAALAQPHVRPMDFTGKPMKGYVFVDPPGLAADADLQRWIDACAAFVAGLPPKDSAKRPGR